MYAILIIDGAGHIREWSRGSWTLCQMLAKRLPENGWQLHQIVEIK